MATSQSPNSILTRRRNDHVLIEQLNRSDCPIEVSAHRSAADARASRGPLRVGDAHPPVAYRASYGFDTLIGPGKRHRPTNIVIDPLANGDYPASEPVASVIGEAPWTPHFANGMPVCHGHRLWVPNRTQLVDYIIHMGRLLNFDEPPPNASYAGYNRAAIDWWQRELDFGPLDPDLVFPTIEPTAVLASPRRRLSPATPHGGSGRRSRLRSTEASSSNGGRSQGQPGRRFRAAGR
jgi:hypothetical protein